jgi:hypothetical protein
MTVDHADDRAQHLLAVPPTQAKTPWRDESPVPAFERSRRSPRSPCATLTRGLRARPRRRMVFPACAVRRWVPQGRLESMVWADAEGLSAREARGLAMAAVAVTLEREVAAGLGYHVRVEPVAAGRAGEQRDRRHLVHAAHPGLIGFDEIDDVTRSGRRFGRRAQVSRLAPRGYGAGGVTRVRPSWLSG